MINCAIYPRKSKANDNSQSMEQQIADCEKYINEHYDNANIVIYDGDYALTGHSTAKRKDFQRMMADVKSGKIQLVVIMRYDRIARNMRDFCNLYHDMEENNCNLVSVSQQIDTSTPYGKNFMYQMAAMAELEWAIISERYKDTAKYKKEHGYAYTGKVSYGYKIQICNDGKKRIVKNPDKNAMVVFDYYKKTRNKSKTVEYIRENYDSKFTYDILRKMLESDMYIGRVPGNDNFCEPYMTESELNEIRAIKSIKLSPQKRQYIFSKLVQCPICGRTMQANYGGSKRNIYYYRCGYVKHLSVHNDISVPEKEIEKQLLSLLEPFLDDKILNATYLSTQKKKSVKSSNKAIREEMDRLNYMYEKGRIDTDNYEKKYAILEEKLSQIKSDSVEKDYKSIKNILCDNWKDTYSALDQEHKKLFWNKLISRIIVNEQKEITDIIFL